MDNEYEIFPHKVLENLKEDVEILKQKLAEPDTVSQELMVEIEDLKTQVKELNNIFKEVLQDLKEEDSGKLLVLLQTKIEKVTTQNETIARGMITISDKLEDFMKKNKPPMTHIDTQPKIAPAPPMTKPSTMNTGERPQTNNSSVPPPPPIKTKRKSIFG